MTKKPLYEGVSFNAFPKSKNANDSNLLTQLPQKLIPQFIRQRLEGRVELQKVIANTGWLFADKIIQIIINLFVGVWVARYLGPELRGILTYADSFVSLFVPLSALGLGTILIREIVREPEAKGELMGTGFVVQLAAYILFLPIIIGAVFILQEGELEVQLSVIIIAFGSIFATSRIFNFWFQSQLQSKYEVLATRIVGFFSAGLKIILIFIKAPLIASVVVISLQIFFYFITKLYYYMRTGESIRTWRFNFSLAKGLIRDGWPLAFSFLAITLYTRIDSVMLGQLMDSGSVGIYGEASRFSNLWYFLPSAIVVSAYPALVRVHDSSSPENYQKRIQQFFDILVLFGLIFAIPISLVAPFVVTRLYGSAYAVSGNVLSVLAWTFVFVSLRQGMDRWLMIENLTRISMWSVILGLIVNIFLNLLLVKEYGETGAAWATVFAIVISIYLPCLIIPKLRPLFTQLVLALFAPFRIYSLLHGR